MLAFVLFFLPVPQSMSSAFNKSIRGLYSLAWMIGDLGRKNRSSVVDGQNDAQGGDADDEHKDDEVVLERETCWIHGSALSSTASFSLCIHPHLYPVNYNQAQVFVGYSVIKQLSKPLFDLFPYLVPLQFLPTASLPSFHAPLEKGNRTSLPLCLGHPTPGSPTKQRPNSPKSMSSPQPLFYSTSAALRLLGRPSLGRSLILAWLQRLQPQRMPLPPDSIRLSLRPLLVLPPWEPPPLTPHPQSNKVISWQSPGTYFMVMLLKNQEQKPWGERRETMRNPGPGLPYPALDPRGLRKTFHKVTALDCPVSVTCTSVNQADLLIDSSLEPHGLGKRYFPNRSN
ncbi:hypothetical protein AAY473_028136 [Plecturocebus cupreus]